MKVVKGIAFPDHVAPFVRHMASVNDHREALTSLRSTWDTLSLLGHLSNLRTDMSGVRQGFQELTGELLSCLAEETLARVTTALGYQAQIAVDVLTRNLYERTADIGFLSTDTPIVQACQTLRPTPNTPHEATMTTVLRQRFRSYVDKYSVYKDIILTDTQGRVLIRLGDGFHGQSTSPIIKQALTTRDNYVETYAQSDLCGDGAALTYAFRVQAEGKAIGVLLLVFDVREEVQTILGNLVDQDESMAFLGQDGRVILSSDPALLPAGYLLPIRPGVPYIRLHGVQYIVAQRTPKNYQGYAGPGWTAVAMLAAEVAFDDRNEAMKAVVFSGENIFSQRLLDIPAQARNIQDRLDRLVWNGRVQQADDSNAFSRSLLEEIANTGRKTKDVFERSSQELLAMVAQNLLTETQFLAALSVDILDRNLYERANDCRWWAQSPALASMDPEVCRKTLRYINGLYTVYSEILVFDARGVVVAASQCAQWEGQALQEPWVAECLRIRTKDGYTVSRFESSSLYANRGTYIYTAPIFDTGNQVRGGVALIFDAEPQFTAMLQSVLPQFDQAVAAFCRTDGCFIGITAALPIALPRQILALQPGQRWSGVVMENERCYTVGAAAGAGYREFKTSDGYAEQIQGVVIVPCGNLRAMSSNSVGSMTPVHDGTEIATFYIDGQLLGIVAEEVIECVELANVVRAPTGPGEKTRHVGFAPYGTRTLPLIDLSAQTSLMHKKSTHLHALVLQVDNVEFGVLITGLGPVMHMHLYTMQQMADMGVATRMVSRIARAGDMLVPVLSTSAVLGLCHASGGIASLCGSAIPGLTE
ncbi:chemotaxis protein CheW [Candidatus Symbiobacter mobilis]|uniref:Methyl-accepting chemotaxis protein n=1 Tax=Candidatus Symbiobacter mobilis CR TaxID=946483 RepID=U5NEN2_9BURK|nr:chemotaxis protein CheW [Candidatus Symbiobacter mobilis]AGX88614.1 methyl-accepting chemotaxis protein [Candidatus Symbiobacter mobilis CR]